MGLATFQFNGVIYEYEYDDNPSDDLVNARAETLNRPGMNKESLKGFARKLIISENRRKKDKAVYALIRRAHKKLLEYKANSGITQSRVLPFKIADVDEEGVVKRAVTPEEPVDTRDLATVELKIGTAADVINNRLYEMLQERLRGNPEKGIAPDGKTVDLKVLKPSDDLSAGEKVHEIALMSSGFGDAGAQYAQEMVRLNRFAKSLTPVARELTGFTFITRPRLNLSQANIANVRSFAPLLYAEDQSASLAIRFLLDTKLANEYAKERKCELFDPECPFLTPLVNRLEGINGFPDPQLAVETTEGGFFSEQQTAVIGYDRLAHGQDLQLQFSDLPGNPIMALHDYWVQYMGYIQDGTLAQYTEDIEAHLMAYTVSIYRFITDATGRQITRWAKATGCFPKTLPLGSIFNVNQGDKVVTANREISMPWWSHHIGYNDPIILKEFNMLVRRYNGWIGQHVNANGTPIDLKYLRAAAINNRQGVPYITQENGFTELVWLNRPDRRPNDRPIVTEPVQGLNELKEIKAANESLARSINFPNNT